MKEMKRITFKIEEGLSDALDQEAVRQHRSRSNLLETMIIRLMAERVMERILAEKEETDEYPCNQVERKVNEDDA